MEWYIFAIIVAILTAVVNLLFKKALLKEHSIELAATFAFVNLFMALILLPKVNYYADIGLVMFLYLVTWFGTLGSFFMMKSFRHMEVSSAAPLFNIGPMFVALLSFIFLKEGIDFLHIIGMVLLLLGVYILQSKNLHDPLSPFKQIKKSKYVKFVFLSIGFYSFASLGDRFLLTHGIDPITYVFFANIFIGINFLIVINMFEKGFNTIKIGWKKAWSWILIASAISLVLRLAQMNAISMANVALVETIKRASALFIIIFAGEIFHEKNIAKKLVATIIMIIGVYIIAI